MHFWELSFRGGTTRVEAVDQWAAWNTLRLRPLEDFGLIVSARRDDWPQERSIPVHTQTLMFIWGRDEDAERAIEVAVEAGLTTAERARTVALETAAQHGRVR